MPPTTRADAGTALSNPDDAGKPFGMSNAEIARALQERFAGREIDTTGFPEAAVEPTDESQGTPEPHKGDTPPDKEEEVLSESNETDATAEAAETDAEDPAEVEAVTEETEEEADAKRYSERTKARIERLAREKAEAKRLADEAAAKVAELESQLTTLKSQTKSEPPPDHGTFSNVWDEGELNSEWQKARQLKRWCEDNRDGAVVGEREYTAAEVKALRQTVEDAMEIHIPQRLQYLRTYKQLKPEIEKVYPWVKDKNSPEYAEAARLKALLPQIALLPEHEALIGDFLVGRKMRLEAKKAAAQPIKAAPKPAPKQPGVPKAVPARTDNKAAEYQQLSSRFEKTQDTRDLAKLLKARGIA